MQDIVIESGGSGQPSDVQGGGDGRIFVADPVLVLLLRYSAAGQVGRSWQIAAANTLDSPHLAAADDGSLYLTEPERGRVLQLSPDGEVVGAWDLPALLGRPVKPVGVAAGPDGRSWGDGRHCRRRDCD